MFPVTWNRHISCYAMHGMDMSRAVRRMEQPRAWTFYAIHTREHMCTVIMHGGYTSI